MRRMSAPLPPSCAAGGSLLAGCHWQRNVDERQAAFAKLLVTALQEQHWPSSEVLLSLTQALVQLPVLVVPVSSRPCVGRSRRGCR
jgi:hypothetical protein